MRQLSGPQRGVFIVAGLVMLVAVLIGFRPVTTTVAANTTYDCGSGFVHSRHTWKLDTRALRPDAIPGLDSTSATPLTACPPKLYRRRDIAYLLLGSALVGGVSTIALMKSRRGVHKNRRVVQSGIPNPRPT